MSDPSSPPERDSDSIPEGFGAVAAGALGSLLDYLEARADLLRWEAREAKSRWIRRLVAGIAALWLLFIAYALGIVALVAWLVQSLELSWPLAALAVAGVHLLLAGACFFFAKSRAFAPAFSDSRAEFRRDREALRRRTETSKPS